MEGEEENSEKKGGEGVLGEAPVVRAEVVGLYDDEDADDADGSSEDDERSPTLLRALKVAPITIQVKPATSNRNTGQLCSPTMAAMATDTQAIISDLPAAAAATPWRHLLLPPLLLLLLLLKLFLLSLPLNLLLNETEQAVCVQWRTLYKKPKQALYSGSL